MNCLFSVLTGELSIHKIEDLKFSSIVYQYKKIQRVFSFFACFVFFLITHSFVCVPYFGVIMGTIRVMTNGGL